MQQIHVQIIILGIKKYFALIVIYAMCHILTIFILIHIVDLHLCKLLLYVLKRIRDYMY